MSCDGWEKGDVAVARVYFSVQGVRVSKGDSGVVLSKNKVNHELLLRWKKAKQDTLLSHDQIHKFLQKREGQERT